MNPDETRMGFSEESMRENENHFEIGTASNFDELYQAIKEKGAISGSRKNYDARTLIEIIDAARVDVQKNISKPEDNTNLEDLKWKIHSNKVIKAITRSEGLRVRVVDLILEEFKNK